MKGKGKDTARIFFSYYYFFFLNTTCSLCFFTMYAKKSRRELYSSAEKKALFSLMWLRNMIVFSFFCMMYSKKPSLLLYVTRTDFGNSSITYPLGISVLRT